MSIGIGFRSWYDDDDISETSFGIGFDDIRDYINKSPNKKKLKKKINIDDIDIEANFNEVMYGKQIKNG